MNALLHIPKRIVIHCSATPNGRPYTVEQCTADHKARGFDTIGYHIMLYPDGECRNGRPLNQVGAHVEGHNNGSIGICLVGTDKFSRKQFQSLRYQIDSLMLTYGIKKHEIWCHNQFDTAIKQGKTCPSIPINCILMWYYEISRDDVLAPFIMEVSL